MKLSSKINNSNNNYYSQKIEKNFLNKNKVKLNTQNKNVKNFVKKIIFFMKKSKNYKIKMKKIFNKKNNQKKKFRG